MLAQTNSPAIASDKNCFANSQNPAAKSYDIAERIRQRDRAIVENALAQGCDYWRMSKAMPKETFKAWLDSQGKTLAEAKKLIRLFETFQKGARSQERGVRCGSACAFMKNKIKNKVYIACGCFPHSSLLAPNP